jgi:hypothetical protein
MAASDSPRSLLDYECLLFYCEGFCSDLQIGHFFSFYYLLVNTPQLDTQLSYEGIIALSQSQSYVRPTVNRPVSLEIKHPSGAYDQTYITVRELWVC